MVGETRNVLVVGANMPYSQVVHIVGPGEEFSQPVCIVNPTLPDASQVLANVQYGFSGAMLTGTLGGPNGTIQVSADGSGNVSVSGSGFLFPINTADISGLISTLNSAYGYPSPQSYGSLNFNGLPIQNIVATPGPSSCWPIFFAGIGGFSSSLLTLNGNGGSGACDYPLDLSGAPNLVTLNWTEGGFNEVNFPSSLSHLTTFNLGYWVGGQHDPDVKACLVGLMNAGVQNCSINVGTYDGRTADLINNYQLAQTFVGSRDAAVSSGTVTLSPSPWIPQGGPFQSQALNGFNWQDFTNSVTWHLDNLPGGVSGVGGWTLYANPIDPTNGEEPISFNPATDSWWTPASLTAWATSAGASLNYSGQLNLQSSLVNGQPCWSVVISGVTWYWAYDGSTNWYFSTVAGQSTDPGWYRAADADQNGGYTPIGSATGYFDIGVQANFPSSSTLPGGVAYVGQGQASGCVTVSFSASTSPCGVEAMLALTASGTGNTLTMDSIPYW